MQHERHLAGRGDVQRTGEKFLAVSSNSVSRDLLSVILKLNGCCVEEASTLEEAEAALARGGFCAVFMDMRPVTLEAKDSAERLMSEGGGAKFVLLADEGDEEVLESAMASGAAAVLTHPFEGDAIVKALELVRGTDCGGSSS